jgi:hypothetical protein
MKAISVFPGKPDSVLGRCAEAHAGSSSKWPRCTGESFACRG